MKLRDLSIQERLENLELKSCQPLPDAKKAIQFAIQRFNESWLNYRTITPTLYSIRDEGTGLYLTLGKLRRSCEMSWETIEAIVEVLEQAFQIEGYMLASEAISLDGEDLLFGLQGHDRGERHYGALALTTLVPFEASFVTEFDVLKATWDDLKFQALTSNPLLQN